MGIEVPLSSVCLQVMVLTREFLTRYVAPMIMIINDMMTLAVAFMWPCGGLDIGLCCTYRHESAQKKTDQNSKIFPQDFMISK